MSAKGAVSCIYFKHLSRDAVTVRSECAKVKELDIAVKLSHEKSRKVEVKEKPA